MYRPEVGSYYYIIKLCFVCRRKFNLEVRKKFKEQFAGWPIWKQEEYRERVAEYSKQYYRENTDRIREWSRLWREKNKEKVRQSKTRNKQKRHHEKYIANKAVAKRTRYIERLQKKLGVII